MTVVVTGAVPAEEFALRDTLSTVSDIEVECERIVKSGERAVMPLLWMRGADREAIDTALSADPTVEAIECLSAFDTEYLYQMEWHNHIRLLLHMMTNGKATILDAYGWNDRWQLRVLYPDRDHLSQTYEFAEDHGFTFEVATVREMDGKPAGRFGLTEGQYDAVVRAARNGYFKVPRNATLDDLAEEMGISRQALSERVRRGIDALVEDTLLVGAIPENEKEMSPEADVGDQSGRRSL